MTPRSSCPGGESTPLQGANLRLNYEINNVTDTALGNLARGKPSFCRSDRCLSYRPPGSLLESRGGSILARAEVKEISAKESTTFDDSVPSMEHDPSADPAQGSLFSPLEQLEADLLATYAGQIVTPEQVYHNHHNGRPYILKNYRQALLHLEETGAITVDPPRTARLRSESLPPDARIKFKAG